MLLSIHHAQGKASTYDDSRDGIEYDVLEPGVHIVEYEKREECGGVERAGLDEQREYALYLGASRPACDVAPDALSMDPTEVSCERYETRTSTEAMAMFTTPCMQSKRLQQDW